MSSQFVKEFGLMIKQRREAKAWSQERFAEIAGLHRTEISLIERGHRDVRIETLKKLAHAFRVQPSELLPEIQFKKRKRVRLNPDVD